MSIELRNKFLANQEKLAEKYRVHTYLRFEEGSSITTYYMELDEEISELLTLAWVMLELSMKFNRILEPSLRKKGSVNDVIAIAEGILFGEIANVIQVEDLLKQNGWQIEAATGWALSTNFKANEFPRKLGTKFINIDLVDDCYADIHSSDKPNEKAHLHSVPKGIDPDFRGTGLIEQSIMASVNEILREHKQEQASEPEAESNDCSKAEEAVEAEKKEKAIRDCIPYYSRGLEYFTQGDLDSAINCFTDAIKCNDNYAPAYFYRARSYWRKKKIDCAVEDMMRALHIAELDSSAFTTVEDLHLADVYFDLGLLHSEINELEKAAGYYHKAQPLLERLSINSSKRKSDYQRLEMLIMSNSSRIQKADNQKKYADSLISNSDDLSEEQKNDSAKENQETVDIHIEQERKNYSSNKKAVELLAIIGIISLILMILGISIISHRTEQARIREQERQAAIEAEAERIEKEKQAAIEAEQRRQSAIRAEQRRQAEIYRVRQHFIKLEAERKRKIEQEKIERKRKIAQEKADSRCKKEYGQQARALFVNPDNWKDHNCSLYGL